MKAFPLCVLLGLSFSALAHASSLIESLEPEVVEFPLQLSAMTLSCPAAEGQYYQSKIALLESGSEQHDFALTTAHGVVQGLDPAGRSCFVIDMKGKRRHVLGAYFAEGYEPGTSTDWAVLKLKKIKANSYTRFALAEIESDVLVSNGSVDVAFPKAIGIGYNTQPCKVYPSEMLGIPHSKILSHDCRVVGGQSGSPISVTRNEEFLLIGVHLGSAFSYRSPITHQPEHMGYFRSIDLEMHEEIVSAVEMLSQ